MLALVGPAAHAQEAAGRSLTIVPSFTVQQTFTDNIGLAATGEQSESITEFSPGISLSSTSGRVRGMVDYSLGALVHARDSSRNTLRNDLSAALFGELVERHAFIEVRAAISQETISAFGTQAGNTGFVNDNRTEVATYSVSPSLRGNLGGWADLVAQASWSSTNAASTELGDGSALDASLSLSGSQGRFGWGLNSSWQRDEFSLGEQSTSDTTFARLSFAPEPELQLSVRGGIEGEAITTGQRIGTDFWGWGVSWNPSERTTLALQSDHRYFGRSHNFSFQHRMARSIWTYTDSRGVNDAAGGGDLLNGAPSVQVSNYQQFYNLFASLQPDPVLRAKLVRDFLRAANLDPNAPAMGGFLGSSKTIDRNQNLSVALTGVRNTITLSAFRSETVPLTSAGSSGGDLATVDRVRQLGYSLGASHSLTPTATLTLSGSRLRTFDEPGQPGNEQRSLTLYWTGDVGARTSASLGLRHTEFDSVGNPYNESAVIGSISMRF